MTFRVQQMSAMEGDLIQVNLQGVPAKDDPAVAQSPACNAVLYLKADAARDLRPGGLYVMKLTAAKLPAEADKK